MKRTTKVWLIIAAALILIGAVGFAGVLSSNGWDFSALGEPLEEETFEIADAFDSISIESDTSDIRFLPSDNGKCRVVFYQKSNAENTAAVADRTLTIGTKQPTDIRKWYEHFSFSFESSRIDVYLSPAKYESLQIQESTGDITIPDNFLFGNIDISASTCDVNCSAAATGSIRIAVSTGDITIEKNSAASMELTASTGRVTLNSVTCDDGIGITVSTGKSFLTNVFCGSLTTTGDTGDMTLKNVIVSGQISIKRTTGDISFDGCDAGELLITTDTGDVEGTLLSEKIFFVKSDTGRIEVPETMTGGKCKITTDTGDIKIDIR